MSYKYLKNWKNERILNTLKKKTRLSIIDNNPLTNRLMSKLGHNFRVEVLKQASVYHKSLSEIGIKKYYGVLLHNPQQLFHKEKESIISKKPKVISTAFLYRKRDFCIIEILAREYCETDQGINSRENIKMLVEQTIEVWVRALLAPA